VGDKRFHLCEFTPNYERPFVGPAVGNTDLDETDAERLDTDIREGDPGTQTAGSLKRHRRQV
jgi:hypothetical protein